MREVGVVTKIDGKFASVKVNKKDECSKCGLCLFPKNADSVEFRANNEINSCVGDSVIIESKKDGKLLGSFLVFLVPLLLIGLSALISYSVIKSEIWFLLLSVISVVLWYTILAVIDKRYKKIKGATVTVVEILKNVKENTNGRDNQRDE